MNDVAYAKLKVQLHNDRVRGIAVPVTIAEAYHCAAKFVIVRPNTKSSYGAAFTTIGESQEKYSEPKEKKKNFKGANISSTEKRLRALEDKIKSEYSALVGKEKHKGDPLKNDSSEKAAPSTLNPNAGGKRRPTVCWECGERGHIAINCPERLDSDDEGEEGPSDEEDL